MEIQVLSYSADGDSREMKTMRQRLELGIRIGPQDRGIFKSAQIGAPCLYNKTLLLLITI